MTLFITIIIYDLRDVFFEAFKSCFIETCINSNTMGTRVKVFFFAFLLLKPLFRLFESFFGELCTIGRVCKLKLLNF